MLSSLGFALKNDPIVVGDSRLGIEALHSEVFLDQEEVIRPSLVLNRGLELAPVQFSH